MAEKNPQGERMTDSQKLDLILTKLDNHTHILEEQGKKLDEHTRILNEHSEKLDEHTHILEEQGKKLDEHTRILNEHSGKLDEHTRILDGHTRILGEHSEKLDEQEKILIEHSEMLMDQKKEIAFIKAVVSQNYDMTQEFYVFQKEHDTGIIDRIKVIEGKLDMHANQIARNTADLSRIA